MRLTLITAAFVAGTLPALAQDGTANTSGEAVTSPGVARATILNAEGDSIGTATILETPNGVLLSAELSQLPPGVHGFHIHETGQCDPADGFKSAGGHYNPAGHDHGYMTESGPHAGDMPNQTVGEDGRLMVEVFNPHLGFSGENTLFDGDGSSIIIHATADDYISQPAGNAGDRIACGVIQQE